MNPDPMAMSGGMRVPTASARRRTANRGFLLITLGSLTLHAGAIGGVVYAQGTRSVPAFNPDAIPVELVKLGKKRDPKLLPRKTAPAPAPPPEGVALDTGPKPAAPEKKKKPKKRSQERLSAAAQRLLGGRDLRMDRALSKLDEAEGSPDGSPLGTTTDPKRAASAYQASIKATLVASYRLPGTIPDAQRQFLSATVVLFIQADGSIRRFEFLKTHPNPQFKAELERLLRTTKLPPPPRPLASQYRKTGVTIRFKPRT